MSSEMEIRGEQDVEQYIFHLTTMKNVFGKGRYQNIYDALLAGKSKHRS